MAKYAIVQKETGQISDIVDEADKFDIYEGADAAMKWCEVPDDTTYEHTMINGVCYARSDCEDLRMGQTLERQNAYGDVGAQLDMQYKDELNGTTTWKDHIAGVKAAVAAPSTIAEFVPNVRHTQLEGRAAWDPWVDNWSP